MQTVDFIRPIGIGCPRWIITGNDVIIDVNVCLKAMSFLGDGVEIGPTAP